MPAKYLETIKKFSLKQWFVIIVMIAGFFLRLYNLEDTVQFQGDQGRDATIVAKIFTERDLVFIGPVTSVGNMYLGPLYYYFMAPFLFLTYPSPMGPVYAVALLGCLTLFLVYYLGKKLVGENAAIIATTLYAFAGIVVENTRFSWNPNPAPLLALLMIYFVHLAMKKHAKYWVLVVLCFSVLAQLHYLALLSGASFGLVWIFNLFFKYKYGEKIKDIFIYSFIGALVFFVSLTPLVLFDLKHDFLNVRAFLNLFSGEKVFEADAQTTYEKLNVYMAEMHGRALHILHEIAIGKQRDFNTFFTVLATIVSLFSIYKIFVSNKKWQIKEDQNGIFIIICFIFMGVLGTSFYQHTIFNHYIAYLFPISFLFLGYVAEKIYRFNFFGKLILLAYLSLFIPFNFNYNMQNLKTIGWKISDIKRVADEIYKRVEVGEKYNIVLLSGTGDLYGQNYRYFLNTDKNKKIVDLYNLNDADKLFIINEETFEIDINSTPIYEIHVFPNKDIYERFYVEGGPEVIVLKK